MKKRPHLTPEEIESFGKEIKELYLETKSKLGKEDLDFAAHYDNQSKFLDLAGRTLMGPGRTDWMGCRRRYGGCTLYN